MKLDFLMERVLNLLVAREIDGAVLYLEKIKKRDVRFFFGMYPLLSFKVNSCFHKQRLLTVCRKKNKKKKK